MWKLTSKRRFTIALGFAVAAGLVVRLILIVRSGWRIDYDEAMMGLLGLRVLRGEWIAFVPAQPTLGALEAYLLAPVFAVFEANLVTFRIVSLFMAAAYILTTGLVGRQALGARVGALAALLAAIAPPYMLIASLKTWGATIETIVMGNMLLLATAYTIKGDRTARQQISGMAAMGLVAGLMFWGAWLGFYYFVPAGMIIAWRGRRALARGWWAAGLAFLIGSLPFWIFNASHSFSTFSAALGGAPLTTEERGAVLNHVWVDLLPRLVSGDPAWRASGPRGLTMLMAAYYAGLIGMLGFSSLILDWRRTKPNSIESQPGGSSMRWMLGIFVIALPLLYLFSGYSRNALNPWGLDATGRYVVMLHTALPVGVAALAAAISRWRVAFARWIGAALILLVVGLNGVGALRLNPIIVFNSPYYDRLPASLEPLIKTLDREGITHVWTDVGIAQVLMFQTHERIVAADYYDAILAGGLVRFPDALAAVKSAPRTAFVVVVLPDQEDPPIQKALDAAGVPYTTIRVPPTVRVYVPARRVDPAEIAAGLGYQY